MMMSKKCILSLKGNQLSNILTRTINNNTTADNTHVYDDNYTTGDGLVNKGTVENGSANMQQLSTSWEFIKVEEKRPIIDLKTDDDGDKDEQQDVAPPRFIKISDGKISLGPPKQISDVKEKEILENRIIELENALLRLQDQFKNSQCGSPTLERDLKEQLENMNRSMKSKERKTMQACRDHKILQARFARQEAILTTMQHENKNLQQRVRQYEHCLDDVMRKVVDAIVAEDSLREEVSMLKSRVRDLEAQNAALTGSPAKGKDEGYCTMSSGQPQPSNGHLEDLPEEPENWLLPPPAEPCSADMEDWSMSQEELNVITLDEDSNEHDWIWNSSGYLNSIMIDSQSDGISQLLKDTIVYSDEEEIACIDFTSDFYKLVNIPSGSTRSLYSHMDADTDDEDDDDISNNGDSKLKNRTSPTPSEAGQALVTSCSSSESESTNLISNIPISNTTTTILEEPQLNISDEPSNILKAMLRNDVQAAVNANNSTQLIKKSNSKQSSLNSQWRKSNGWKRLPTCNSGTVSIPVASSSTATSPTSPTKIKKDITTTNAKKIPSPIKKSKIPPPVPVRRSYAS